MDLLLPHDYYGSASAENQSELDPSIFNEILVIITWSLSKKRETYHVFQSNKHQVHWARPQVNIGKFLYRMVMKSRENFPQLSGSRAVFLLLSLELSPYDFFSHS